MSTGTPTPAEPGPYELWRGAINERRQRMKAASPKVTVVFGAWLIFDRFPSKEDAELFAAEVSIEYGRLCRVELDGPATSRETLFPWVLDPPVVLVQRDKNWTHEDEIEKAAAIFGGTFAGT